MHTAAAAMEKHLGYVLGIVGVLALLLAFWVARKVFDGRRGEKFPVEDEADNIPE
jgi:hypothetical protein